MSSRVRPAATADDRRGPDVPCPPAVAASLRVTDQKPAATESPSPAVTVSAPPASEVPLAQRTQARIKMPIDGDDMVEVGGSLWIKSEIGYVIRVDPRTNRVLGKIRLDDKGLPFKRYCQGIGTDGTSVWTCSTHLKTTTMVRLDPTTGAVVESFDIDKFYDQLRLPYVDGRIWVSADGGRTLAGLRAGGDVRRLALDKACGQVAGNGSSLVVSCFIDGVVQRVDARDGQGARAGRGAAARSGRRHRGRRLGRLERRPAAARRQDPAAQGGLRGSSRHSSTETCGRPRTTCGCA